MRGPHFPIITEEGKKYACAVNSNPRAGTGVRDNHYALENIGLEQKQYLLNYFKGVEHLFMEYMNTYYIPQVIHEIELVYAKTLTSNKDV